MCASGLRCLRRQLAAKFAVSAALRGSSSCSCLCLSFTCSWVGVVWLQVCGPTCSSCVLGSSGVSVAPFCRLGFWSHPLPSLVPRWASAFGVCWTWVGRLRSCLGSCLLLVGNSPSLVLVVFAWRFLLCVCPGSLCFSCTLSWGSSSRFQFFADSSGWLRIALGYPPSVAWRRGVLPWFFCQGLVGLPSWGCVASGCLSPAVFMVFAMGSPVSGRAVFFLSPRSSQSLSLLLVGLVPGLSAGSPASGWSCVLGWRSS